MEVNHLRLPPFVILENLAHPPTVFSILRILTCIHNVILIAITHIRSSFDFDEADKDLPEMFDPNEIISASPTFRDRLSHLPMEPLQMSSVFTEPSDLLVDDQASITVPKKRKSLSPTSKRKLLFDPETELTADHLSAFIRDTETLIYPHTFLNVKMLHIEQ